MLRRGTRTAFCFMGVQWALRIGLHRVCTSCTNLLQVSDLPAKRGVKQKMGNCRWNILPLRDIAGEFNTCDSVDSQEGFAMRTGDLVFVYGVEKCSCSGSVFQVRKNLLMTMTLIRYGTSVVTIDSSTSEIWTCASSTILQCSAVCDTQMIDSTSIIRRLYVSLFCFSVEHSQLMNHQEWNLQQLC